MRLSAVLPQFDFEGVHVEFVLQPKAHVSRIASAEQLTMHQLLDQYAAATKMKPQVKERAHAILQVCVGRGGAKLQLPQAGTGKEARSCLA